MLKKLVLHPFLLALYPVLALLASNVSQVLFSDTVRSFAVAVLLAFLLLGLFRIVAGGWPRAALLASGALVCLFSYGHVFSLIKGVSLGPILIGRTAVLLPLWVGIFGLFAWWLSRLSNPGEATRLFNIVGLFLLLFPSYTVLSYDIQAQEIRRSRKIETPAALLTRFSGKPPDIYYIILDMHARTDVLKAFYAYDDSWFTNALREKGFYVAQDSTSNYSSTLQSISSSLNMEYINYLEAQYGTASNNREPLGLLLQQNKVFSQFQENGYELAAFQSDDFYTEFRDLQHYMKPGAGEVRRYQDIWSLNPFEGLLVQSTAARVFYDLGVVSSMGAQKKSLETPYDLHRLTVSYALKHLPDFAGQNGAYFVFAHIVAPHPPYVFGRNGERISHTAPFSLSAPGRQDGGPAYARQYADQLNYVDAQVLDVVDRILARSDTPPIIIIQADHGPVSYVGKDELKKSNMWEQHAILNAYYFPGANYSQLYPSITPVNSFRVVLNTFFGGNYELLSDENYFLPHARPYEFVNVTARVKSDQVSP